MALLIMMAAIVGIVLTGFLVVLINSPGKLPPLTDERGNVIPGSLSEKTWVEINGITQGMFIRGENPQNPVVLYVHGGPGTPMLQFITAMEKSERLEKYFTVCYWDQRGSGMTYAQSKDPSALTVEQMVEDTREVTEYLKSRFGQDKIYLLGHSWGSYLSVKTIEKYPENYLAYIGVGQTVNLPESERLSYDFMLGHAKEINDKEVVEKLEKYDPRAADFPSLEYLFKVRTGILEKYGRGRVREDGGATFPKILQAFFRFKGYTLREKIDWFLGADFSGVILFPTVLLKDNLMLSSVKFEVPFYILQGVYDGQCSPMLAERYLDTLEAPKKGFYTFAHSAHSPNMEEPEEFVKVFRKIASENPGI
ncbi:MAG: alpha/beta hydrolase [Firmicutes bacterium]|nr:alpha/beta hydrolase [Bacillota bacterium]